LFCDGNEFLNGQRQWTVGLNVRNDLSGCSSAHRCGDWPDTAPTWCLDEPATDVLDVARPPRPLFLPLAEVRETQRPRPPWLSEWGGRGLHAAHPDCRAARNHYVAPTILVGGRAVNVTTRPLP
jgi:hypothetical protein